MELERAKEIVHAINCASYATMRIDGFEVPKWLEEVSLADMLEAKAAVERLDREQKPDVNGTRTFHMKPDDRLIAAVYVLLHYDAGRYEPILTDARLDRALVVGRLSDLAREEEEGDE